MMNLQSYLQIYFPSLRKFAIAFLLLTVIVPGTFMYLPQKAEAIPVIVAFDWQEVLAYAEWLVQTVEQIYIDNSTTITSIKTTYLALKESTLDPLARLLGAQLTDSLMNQMFSFISKGNVINYTQGATATGNETFVTNQQQYFGNVAQESTQVFLTDLQNNRPDRMQSINKAVSDRIIAENYVDSKLMEKSTFPGGDAAYQAYVQDSSNCNTGNPWDCYFAAREPQNNPWDIYQLENEKLIAKRTGDTGIAKDEVLGNNNFITLKNCVEKDINQNCVNYLNNTPGDVIKENTARVVYEAFDAAKLTDELQELPKGYILQAAQDFMTSKGLL